MQGTGLEIRLDAAGDGSKERGKGVFATRRFMKGEVVLRESPLVAMQHARNKPRALVCASCFKFVGSIEQQLEWCECVNPTNGPSRTSAIVDRPWNLPLSNSFHMPRPVPCACCSSVVYCSEVCREQAWSGYHCILCRGQEIEDINSACTEDAGLESFNELDEFFEHSLATNDVFQLAATVIASVLLSAARNTGSDTSDITYCRLKQHDSSFLWEALKRAWRPYSMGQKALWWQCIALPRDVPQEHEESFRSDLQDLAEESLGLLHRALHTRVPVLVESFPALFHPLIWGHILGMFELNNLNLIVPNPVVRWGQMILAGIESGHVSLEEIHSQKLLSVEKIKEILEEEDDYVCEGNAFYSMQACINHSCCPNCHAYKDSGEDDGSAVILAMQDINPGEEITICYIDHEASFRERQEDLRDYGFICKCDRCMTESSCLANSIH